MAGFSSYGAVADAHLAGRERYATYRKSTASTTTAGIWFDMSMATGMPTAQYYAAEPLKATAMRQSTNRGLYHGPSVSPSQKRLRSWGMSTPTSSNVAMLLDYLLYYPFIDESVTDPQEMDNTVTLPRYATGDGVQMLAVVVGAHSISGGFLWNVEYTNSLNVAGRITPTLDLCTAQNVNGTIATSMTNVRGFGPFIPLQSGDTGVKSVERVTFSVPSVGLLAIVLVKPLATLSVPFNGSHAETDYLLECASAPAIEDDAYLNFIFLSQSNLASQLLFGDMTIAWE